jgi:hypothetical protein
MDIQEFANMLDGREYGEEIIPGEEKNAKALGLVIVFGASDDLAEFRGAINDEASVWDGGEVFLDKHGLFEGCEEDCKYSKAAKEKCKVIEAIWCGEPDYSWTYKTDIPHATFDIMEDGEKYCRGIVFELKSLEANVNG